jgi:16S rRNA (uracil1498-N3)-methyltransferase
VRLTRVYHDGPLEAGQFVPLNESSAHHLRNVLRLKAGQEIMLFNGMGGEYQARIHSIDKKSLTLEVIRYDAIDRESSLSITLVQGISKGQRMDFSIQKAVELGVDSIQPITTERCAVRQKGSRTDRKSTHWQGVIASAAEQSGRTRFPGLMESTSLNEYLKQTPDSALKLVLDPLANDELCDLQPQGREVHLLIGPEGGLSDQEINTAKDAGFQPIKMGPRILRTETAGVAAIAVMQALWGDLCKT